MYGLSVVNGYAAILGEVFLDITDRNDDLPAFGNPTNPISAMVFSSSSRDIVQVGSPFNETYLKILDNEKSNIFLHGGPLISLVTKYGFPFPPLPPLQTK